MVTVVVDAGSVVVVVVEDTAVVVVDVVGEDVVWPLQVSRGGVKGPDTQLPHSASTVQYSTVQYSTVPAALGELRAGGEEEAELRLPGVEGAGWVAAALLHTCPG